MALLALYPVLVYVGLKHAGGFWVAGALIVVCVLRLLIGAPLLGRLPLALLCAGGVLLAVLGIAKGSPDLVLYYPVLVNGGLLLLFAHSLLYPPTMIERIARIRVPNLPPKGVAYTRGVTIVWTIFFLFNGSIAFYTALETSAAAWAFYNGFLAYVLIGLLFGVEFLVRMRVMKSSQP